MTGLRSKINDRFDFPHQINMTPYNVASLKDPPELLPPDMFELVGVLVHSGTAESGHYYSYIRERPINHRSGTTWIEYNDAEISPFDPAYIADQCYGGFPDNCGIYAKHNNAYMLFFQRKQAMASDIRTYRPSVSGSPVKIDVPASLADRIALENACFTRKYCLYGDSYVSFAATLVNQLGQISKGVCSTDHLIERKSIFLALRTLDQVFSRSKDCTGFDKILGSLRKIVGRCSKCCQIAVAWTLSTEESIRNMLLRCPSPKIRKEFGAVVLPALRHLREKDQAAYGLFNPDDTDGANIDPRVHSENALLGTVRHLKELWKYMAPHNRAWDDYFGLLSELASFGAPEAYILVREGFIQFCLEVLIIDHHEVRHQLAREHNPLRQYLRLMERGRKYSLQKLIELLHALLGIVELSEQVSDIEDDDDRPIVNGKASLSRMEDTLLRYGSSAQRPRTLVFLEKILSMDHNRRGACGIIRTLLLSEPDIAVLSAMQKTILNGVNVEPASLAAPYLDAALAFCEYCHNPTLIRDVIKHIAIEVDTIGVNGGREHLDFFSCARRLSNSLASKSQSWFHRLVLQNVPNWAPALVMYWDESIRSKTITLLRNLVFDCDTHNMDNEQEADEIEKVGRDLCEACVKRIEDHFIEPQKAADSKHVENVASLIRHCITLFYNGHDAYRLLAIHAESESSRFYYSPVLTAIVAVLDNLQALIVAGSYDAVSGEYCHHLRLISFADPPDAWNDDGSTNPTDSESENLDMSNGI